MVGNEDAKQRARFSGRLVENDMSRTPMRNHSPFFGSCTDYDTIIILVI